MKVSLSLLEDALAEPIGRVSAYAAERYSSETCRLVERATDRTIAYLPNTLVSGTEPRRLPELVRAVLGANQMGRRDGERDAGSDRNDEGEAIAECLSIDFRSFLG